MSHRGTPSGTVSRFLHGSSSTKRNARRGHIEGFFQRGSIKKISQPESKQAFIRKHSLDRELPEAILDSMELFRCTRDEYLYHQGDQARFLYILLEGKLQVDLLQPNGYESVFSFETPLSLIGELEVLDDLSIYTNVRVLEESQVFRLPVASVREYGYNDPKFLRFLLRHVVRKIVSTSSLLSDGSLPSMVKVAHYLNARMEKEGRILRLEKGESIAAMLGLSVRQLNRVLKELTKLQIIQLHYKTLSIKDPEGLISILSRWT